jgi:CO/xanthine dehydrogenase FAD-binding subunit
MVNHVIPLSYTEALEVLKDGSYQIIAGGTDLMIQKRSSANTPPKFDKNILYVFNLQELKYVIKESNSIRIGSMTSLESLLNHDLTPSLLKTVIKDIASPGLRYVATLAGNIANASPAGDTLVALYLLDATVVLESIYGIRKLPIEQVILGPRQTVINQTEIIKEIIIPDHNFTKTEWVKVGGRKADAISKVSFCGAVTIIDQKIVDLRISLGAVYKTVIRNKAIERILIEEDIKHLKENPEIVCALYDSQIKPIDDQRSNQVYRKKVAKNLIKSFIQSMN